MKGRRWSGSIALTAAVLAAALLPPAGASAAPRRAHAARSALPAFASCPSLLRWARAGAHRTNGQPGVPPRAIPANPTPLVTPAPGPVPASGKEVAAPTTAQAGADASATPFSSTNNQEADVDEPDLVKTDGRRVFTVTDRTLRVVDVTGAQPAVVATLPLEGFGHQLLLRGDTLLVIADAQGYGYPSRGGGGGPIATLVAPMPGRGRTIITEVGVGDAAKPVVRRTMTVDGDFVDARQNGGTARLVIDSAPDQIQPQEGESVSDAIDETHSTDFIGGTVLRSRVSGRTYRRRLVHCEQVRHPRAFSGLDVLTIMTVDLDKGLYSLDRDGVMAGAQVVYGSDRSLYVASQRYDAEPSADGAVPDRVRTEIHRFDISDPERTTYRATGSVAGYVLNQYSLSEYQGDLRVATTEDPLWTSDDPQPSSSAVTVLRQDGAALAQVGRVGGLGAGERIYAVRFLGDRGYVVTFRQTDPLFVLDLADPAAPKLRGELQLPGYSAYLHPVGGERLLGIGMDATADGRRTGAQASLFDVSDAGAPKRVAQLAFGNGRFEVEDDPHAFLWWDPAKLAVLPVSLYGQDSTFSGAVGVRVGTGLTEAGRIAHPATGSGYAPDVSRALVIGDRLLTLSYAGLLESRLSDLGVIGFTSFSGPSS